MVFLRAIKVNYMLQLRENDQEPWSVLFYLFTQALTPDR